VIHGAFPRYGWSSGPPLVGSRGPYPLPRAPRLLTSTAAAEVEAWRALCGGGLDFYDIEARHGELLLEPTLTEVSAIIERYLEP
jgi:hypothetical protein